MVEQNAAMALSIADRGYVLSTGEIVLEGPASELLRSEDLKRAYLGAMREAHEPWLTALESTPSSIPAPGGMGWSGGWWRCRRGRNTRARPGRAANSGS
jgi:hypothetical protein